MLPPEPTAIAANPPEGVQGVKALIDGAVGRSLQEGYEAEYRWMLDHMADARRSGADVFSGFLSKPKAAPAGS